MIDTAQKRRSAMSAGGMAHLLPLPSGVIEQGAQQDVLWIYDGILMPSVVPPLINYIGIVSDIGGYTATVIS